MATLDISLAWSVPVPVEILGAHLQAYVGLQPAITALRLCNRFGKGPQAAITTLPVELVTSIEDYLMADERKKQRKNWKTDFACFQGLCKPIDHLSDSEQVGIWLDVLCGCPSCDDGCCSDGEPEDVPTTKLNGRQQKGLARFLEDVIHEEGPEEGVWWMEHQNRASRWEGKTGAPYGLNRGLLSTYSTFLSRNFGLGIWVTHTQPKKKKKDQFTVVDVYASTIAHLTLPRGKVRDDFDRGFSNDLFDIGEMPYPATESGGSVPVVAPCELSHADVFRFSRAAKLLGLKPKDSEETKAKLYASPKDEEIAKMQDGEVTAADDSVKKWTPKLRVLYSVAVDDGY